MRLDGPLEERADHEGLTYAQLRAERDGTMSPARACEAARRMRCLEEGRTTFVECLPHGDDAPTEPQPPTP